VSAHDASAAAVEAAAASPRFMHHGRGPQHTTCVHTRLIRGVVVEVDLGPILESKETQLLAKGLGKVIVAKRTEDAALPERARGAGLKLLRGGRRGARGGRGTCPPCWNDGTGHDADAYSAVLLNRSSDDHKTWAWLAAGSVSSVGACGVEGGLAWLGLSGSGRVSHPTGAAHNQPRDATACNHPL